MSEQFKQLSPSVNPQKEEREETDLLSLVKKIQQHLVFLFARHFHPSFKHFAAVRQELGFPTVFNVMGPLLNPAQTERQIIGVSQRKTLDLLAQTCKLLGKKRVMVVCGADGLDEVTLTGKTFTWPLPPLKAHPFSRLIFQL